jgi:cytidylate kinase
VKRLQFFETDGGKAINENLQAIATMRAVTISREYGSGGGEIAARLALRLGWQLIDHAVIEQTAREFEVPETEVEKHDEEYVESTHQGILSRILEQLAPSASMTGGGGIIVSREGLDTEAARRRVQAKDQARTHFMQTQYHCQHEDPHLYDLVISTSVLSLDSVVDLICLGLEGKASRLTVPVEQLGPAAGLAAYPDKPADFRESGQPSN